MCIGILLFGKSFIKKIWIIISPRHIVDAGMSQLTHSLALPSATEATGDFYNYKCSRYLLILLTSISVTAYKYE